MIKIAPSILSADFAYLARDIEKISTADYVHVDVMDGLFVPNISIGIPVVKSIRPTTTLPLDVHLMIDRPVRYVEQFCDAGGDLITCHVEADTEENIHAAIDKIHAKLEVDGGVDAQTCKLCIAAGANVLVAGSSVYKSADIPATIAALRG